jgi:GAF domain-containing protein
VNVTPEGVHSVVDDQDQQLSRSLSRLAGVVLTEETSDAILDLVVSLARSTIQGADGAGVTIMRDDKFTTAAHSDPIVREVDAFQYEFRDGPCLSAMIEGNQTRIESMVNETRWPQFVPRARDKGILSTWSFPLTIRGKAIGALNLYSKELEGFRNSDENIARTFAVQASTVLSNALAYSTSAQLTGQLREALESRQLIGEATGILMERLSCSREAAFDRLRQASNNTNVKLKDVARAVFESVQRSP